MPNPDILQTTNNEIRILDNILGRDLKESFYEYFYTSFLGTANSLPLNCLWIVFINSIPEKTGTGKTVVNTFNDNLGATGDLTETYAKASYEAKRTKAGLVIAQSVKEVGESFNVERKGPTNSGYVQGLIGTGRTGFPLLNISFMENNVSFVDYVLRPWAVAVANNSLKDIKLKTDITVWHLGKMGVGRKLAIRKAFIYKGCAPVNIDEQEYNYTGGDVLLKRDVQFVFNSYEVQPSDESLLKLIGVEKGFWGGVLDDLRTDVERELGVELGPNTLGDLANKLITDAREFGQDLIQGTLSRVITNTAGALGSVVGEGIREITGDIRGEANRGITSINEEVNRAINNVTDSGAGSTIASLNDPNKDTVRGSGVNLNGSTSVSNLKEYKEVNLNQNDTPIHRIPSEPDRQRRIPPVINTNIPISQDDAPLHLPASDVIANISASRGKVIPASNRVSDSVTFKIVTPSRNDAPAPSSLIFGRNVNVNKSDIPDSVSFKVVTPNADDARV